MLPVQEPAAEMGLVTLGGDPAGVSLGGERRRISVYGPGGYSWRPSVGDRVLILKAGAERESPCILGVAQDAADLTPGQVRLSNGNSSVTLAGKRLELRGEVQINGVDLDSYIRAIVASMLA